MGGWRVQGLTDKRKEEIERAGVLPQVAVCVNSNYRSPEKGSNSEAVVYTHLTVLAIRLDDTR